MSPPVPVENQCGTPIKKHDGTGRSTTCAISVGHKDSRHRDAEYLAGMRALDTVKRRRKYRSRNYGRDHSWYEMQLDRQQGGCAICGKTPEENRRELAVDHDHACCPGKRNACGQCVRGLLCDDCNQLLGRAHDDTSILLAAADYLTYSRTGGGPHRRLAS